MSNLGYRAAVAVLVLGVVGGFGSGVRSMKHHHDRWNRDGGGCHSQHQQARDDDDAPPPPKTPTPAE